MTIETTPAATSPAASPPPDLEVLRSLLVRARAHVPAPQPKTFFSIGRRSHWENPASDVMAFFLDPREEHGFGPLFLRVFLGCMGVDVERLGLENGGVSVNVEERLESDERIDLMVSGTGWVLAIENKVDHWVANDLEAYAAHVRGVAGPNGQVHLALLAPRREKRPGWTPVTYPDLCRELAIAFDQQFTALPTATSKWQVFAREFVTHLQVLRQPTQMKLDAQQREFIEGHLADIQNIKRLSADYTAFLQNELTERLRQVLPDRPPFGFVERDRDWALVCDDPKGSGWRLAFQTPGHYKGNPHRKFLGSIHLGRQPDGALRDRAQLELAEMFYTDGWWWSSHDNREAAVASLCEMVRRLFGPGAA